MKRGDICWVALPGGEGRAQAGRRPSVVLQDSRFALPTTLVVPLTTQLDALRFPGTVLIEPDAANGLRLPSVALVFQLRALDMRCLEAPAGVIPATKIEEVLQALDELTGR